MVIYYIKLQHPSVCVCVCVCVHACVRACVCVSVGLSICLSVCNPLFSDATVGSRPNLARMCV